MKWKNSTIDYNLGDIKIVRKFSWLPVTLSNGTTIWLEEYKQKHRRIDDGIYGWEIIEDLQ